MGAEATSVSSQPLFFPPSLPLPHPRIKMVGTKNFTIRGVSSDVEDKAAQYWNPQCPKFYDHLVYGAGKPRCVVPLEAFRKANKLDENFGRKLRQEYTDMARSGSADELTNLAFFNLIIDNDLENGGDLLKDAAKPTQPP